MIGTIVKVMVDRPLGSYHPKYKDLFYPINYGFIEGVIAPDGEEDWFDDEGNWTEAGIAVLGSQVQALEIYKQLEKIEPSAELYNNIANTYFRMSDYVNSTLYYEKALKLFPRNEIYQVNNKISKTRLIGDVYKIPEFFLNRWIKSIYNLFTPMTWAILTLALLLFAAILFFIYYFSSDKKVLFFYLMLSCFILSIFSFSFGLARENAIHSQDYAIVIKLSEENQSKQKLFKGQKVEIKERKLEKIRVQTEDGKEYWIEKDMVEII
jgi:tetratricopeptide (TPR) repeat protein